MSGMWKHKSGWLMGLWLAGIPLGASAQPANRAAEDPPGVLAEPQPDPATRWRLEVERLTGACLTLQAEQRALRDQVRDSVEGLNGLLTALNQVAKVLTTPEPEPESAATVRATIDQLDEEEARIERWIWGEELPDEPGVTREALRERLSALRVERRSAAMLVEAYALQGAFDREQMRARVVAQAESIRQEIDTATQPMRQRLEALDQVAGEEGEPFEAVMSEFARISAQGPVAVEAVRADGWFQHGLVSFRWSDRRGRLVATAQVRLRPSIDRDMPPPLLLDRFAIIAQTALEAEVSVGHFSVAFRVAVPEIEGEQAVLDALVRLLDLEALGAVQPDQATPGQN